MRMTLSRLGPLSYALILAILFLAGCASAPKPHEKTPKELSNLYLEMGTGALLRGEYTQAVTDLRKSIDIDSENSVAHNHLGLAYYALRNIKLAIHELNYAVRSDPNNSDAYINLGNIALHQKDYTAAEKFYKKALSNLEYKMRHRALTSLGKLYFIQNKMDKSRAYLYQSLAANQNYCLTHFLLGSIFKREKSYAKAAKSFLKSIDRTCVNNPEGHLQLGMAYLRMKNYSNARTKFVYLVEEFPQTIQAKKAGEQLRYIP